MAPDVAVLDVRLPDGHGIELCRELISRLPDLRYLMLTSFADDEALFDAIMAGAAGFVLKRIVGTDLTKAIQTVAAGQSLLDARSQPDPPRAREQRSGAHAHRAGAHGARPDRGGPHEQADRGQDVPRRTQAAVLASKLHKPAPLEEG
ncbi:MAG TPA: response regulator transcription factor [Lentzea sp.]